MKIVLRTLTIPVKHLISCLKEEDFLHLFLDSHFHLFSHACPPTIESVKRREKPARPGAAPSRPLSFTAAGGAFALPQVKGPSPSVDDRQVFLLFYFFFNCSIFMSNQALKSIYMLPLWSLYHY